jgi:hypothetical protein
MRNYKIEIMPRDGKLYLKYYEDGKLQRKSTRLDDTKSNRAYLEKQVIPDLQSRHAKGEKLDASYSMKSFLDKVLLKKQCLSQNTLLNYKLGARLFLDYFGQDKDIRAIKAYHIEEYIDDYKKILLPFWSI